VAATGVELHPPLFVRAFRANAASASDKTTPSSAQDQTSPAFSNGSMDQVYTLGNSVNMFTGPTFGPVHYESAYNGTYVAPNQMDYSANDFAEWERILQNPDMFTLMAKMS
jgi:hypothetical protein